MNKTLFLLFVLLLALCGCGDDMISPPEVPEESTPMGVEFGMSVTSDFVPFGSTPALIVTGGSGQFAYELSRDVVVIGSNPLETMRFDEAREYVVNIEVTDLETGQVENRQTTVTGLQPPAGLPLSARLYVSDYFGEVPYSLSAMGIARGGQGPYNHQLILNDEAIYEDDQGPLSITEVDDYQRVVYRVTDATGAVAEDFVMVSGFAPGEAPDFQGVMILGGKRVSVGTPVFIAVIGMSGTPPYVGRIEVDNQQLSGGFITIFTPSEAREYLVKGYLSDSNGEQLVFEETIEVYEQDEFYIRPIDATGTPNQAQQNEDISFHADVRVLYDLVEWRVIGNETFVAYGDDITRSFPRVGFEHVEARAYYQGNFVCADTTRVTITPADEPLLLRNEVTGGPQGQVAGENGVTISLESHPSGGDGNYSYVWYWPTADQIFSTERFPVREGVVPGMHTFVSVVTDGVGNTAEDEVVITVLAPPIGDEETWTHCPGLQVGPDDDFSSTTATVDVTGDYSSFVQIEWDALPSGTADAILAEVVRPDGHRYTWRFDKPENWGRRTVYYEVGDLDLQAGDVTLNFYWLGDTLAKNLRCDGWNKWQLISGNTEILSLPQSGGPIIVRLDDPYWSQYVTQQ